MNTKETAAKLPRLNSTNLTSAAVLIALAVLLSVISPAFRDPQNLINILQQVTVNAILALGMTMVIFTGGIDLSVGSVVAFSGIVMGILVIDLGVNPWLAALIGIALGSVCGTINGLLISRFKLQPMIATLGMMSIARGAALTLAGGRTISGYPPGFTWLGNGTIPGTTIPVQIVFMLLLYVIAASDGPCTPSAETRRPPGSPASTCSSTKPWPTPSPAPSRVSPRWCWWRS